MKPEKMTLGSFIKGLFVRIWSSRRWYLLPLWFLLVLIALIIVVTGHGSILPAIYMTF